ncbi:MAG: T9SS type A sorting domain-containing protein [Bacteroidota bacterium]
MTSRYTRIITINGLNQPIAECKPTTVQVLANETITLSPSAINNNSQPSCDGGSISYQFADSNLHFEIRGDIYGWLNGWSITSLDEKTVFAEVRSLPAMHENGNSNLYEYDIQLPPGCYNFIWFDRFKEGYDCYYEEGSEFYRLTDANGNILAFKACKEAIAETTKFCVEADNYSDTLTYDCTNTGERHVGLAVTGENGQIATCNTTVKVKNTPTAVCKPLTIQLDNENPTTISADQLDGGSFSVCGEPLSYKFGTNNLQLEIKSHGWNAFRWSITSLDGNTVFAERIRYPYNPKPGELYDENRHFLEDIQLPPGCYRINWVDPLGGFCGGNSNKFFHLTDSNKNSLAYGNCRANQSTEFCVEADTYNKVLTFDCNNPGEYPIGLVVRTKDGSTDVCKTNITVEGGPTAVCQPISVQMDDEGQRSISAAQLAGSSFSSCGNIQSYQFNGNLLKLEILSDGNNEDFSWTITSRDGNTIYAQNDSYGQYDSSIRAFSETFYIPEGCYLFNWKDKRGDGFLCPTYTNQPFYRLTDALGNELDYGADCSNIRSGRSNLICVEAVSFVEELHLNCNSPAQKEVIVTITDEQDNKATCQTTISIEGGEIKAVECIDKLVDVNLDENGQVNLSPEQFMVGQISNCNINSVSLDHITFDCNNLGIKTITLNAIHANGSSSSCEAQVRITEYIAPTANCKDVTAQLNSDGQLILNASNFNNESTDNCGISGFYYSDFSTTKTYNCTDVGVHQLFDIIIEDYNSNLAYCNATLTIEDKTPPNISTQNITITLDNNKPHSITPNDIDDGSHDACGIEEMKLDQTEFSIDNIGENTVLLTVTDMHGNATTEEATVTVVGNFPPTAICQDVTVKLDVNGNGSITVNQVDNGSNDMDGIKSLSLDNTTFDCTNVERTNTVTLTVTDNTDKTNTCNAQISVLDEIQPIAICKNVTVFLDENGQAQAVPSDFDNGSFDHCGGVSIAFTDGSEKLDFSCGQGPSTSNVALTVTDESGNTSTCTQEVLVLDNIPPVARCKDATVELDAQGQAAVDVFALLNDGSSDNCQLRFTSSGALLTCNDIGTINPFTFTVSDPYGNTHSCTADITVVAKIAPIAKTQDITIQLSAANPSKTISPYDIDNGSTNVCGIASMSVFPNTFSCVNAGENTVTLSIVDINGNEMTTTAKVTVIDNTIPNAVCKDITVQLGQGGYVTVTPDQISASTPNGCGIANLSLDIQDFGCTDFGDNEVQLMVTGSNGQMNACMATVTVEQNRDLPNDFSTQSVGSSSGDAFYNTCDEVFDLNSARTAVYDHKAGFGEFTYVNLNGDFTFTAELHSMSSSSMAGLMIRENGNSNSAMAWIGKKGHSMTGWAKLNQGDKVLSKRSGRASRRTVLTVNRTGDVVNFKQGNSTLLSLRVSSMSSSIQVGMYLSSADNNEATAQFKNVGYSSNTASIASIQLLQDQEAKNQLSLLRESESGKTLALNAWPNPSSGLLNIQMEAFIGNAAQVKIYDLTGRVLYTENLGIVYQSQQQLDLSGLEAGVYIVTVESVGKVAQERIIKH